jgi:uncharacterized protein (DUF1697 family)
MRAVNVAGHARVSMTSVRDAFVAAGCRDVRTFIQSGNVVFAAPAEKSASVLEEVRRTLQSMLGEEPQVLLRTVTEIERLIDNAPFLGLAESAKVKRYVAFLFKRPRRTPEFPLVSPKEALEAIEMRGREVFIVSRPKPNGFFGFPNNFIEERLGVPATTRNWATIKKIVAL